MIKQTRNSKYPLILAEYAFDLACEYGWKPKLTNWHEPFIQVIHRRFCGEWEEFNADFADMGIFRDDLTEEDRTEIADALEKALNEIPDDSIEYRHPDIPYNVYMDSSLYKKHLVYKLAFWSEHKADLKEFIQLLRQDSNQIGQP